MRKRVLSIILVSMILTTLVVSSFSVQAKSDIKRQIVVFEDNISSEKKAYILDKYHAVKIKEIKGTNGVVISAASNVSISGELGVRLVEEDFIIGIEGNASKKDKSSDNQTTEQTDEVVPWGVDYMNDLMSDSENTGAGVKIGIIDTGVDVNHPDIADNIKDGYNATSNKKSYDDDNGHGTHVAGIIAAADNEIGVIGVAPDAEIYAVKALDSFGNGYVSDVIESIEWCIDNDIDIINMSIGMSADSEALHETIVDASHAGVLIVAAAGNNYGGRCEYPAAYEEVIGVGAIDYSGNLAGCSAMIGVDVWAPGVEIYSTFLNSGYKIKNGTSMAAPHWIKILLRKNIN